MSYWDIIANDISQKELDVLKPKFNKVPIKIRFTTVKKKDGKLILVKDLAESKRHYLLKYKECNSVKSWRWWLKYRLDLYKRKLYNPRNDFNKKYNFYSYNLNLS